MVLHRVQIKSINWLDRGNPEAIVEFILKGNPLKAFCHPCDFVIGEVVDVNFSFIEEEISDVVFWTENVEKKKKLIPVLNTEWRYLCYGEIIQVNPMLIDCESIIFDYGESINDQGVIGGFVYFVVSRLDIERA
jgi:hypothetical protein